MKLNARSFVEWGERSDAHHHDASDPEISDTGLFMVGLRCAYPTLRATKIRMVLGNQCPPSNAFNSLTNALATSAPSPYSIRVLSA